MKCLKKGKLLSGVIQIKQFCHSERSEESSQIRFNKFLIEMEIRFSHILIDIDNKEF